MDKNTILRALNLLRVDHLRQHLKRSTCKTLGDWWSELAQDSRKCPFLRHQGKALFYSLWCAAAGRLDLEADVEECYTHLCSSEGNLGDIPWPIIEEALGQYITKQVFFKVW
jgi:hypothetical protein